MAHQSTLRFSSSCETDSWIQFGGLTFFPQRIDGFWTFGGVTYRDEIVIYRILTDKVRIARRFFRELKEELKLSLEQKEILIVEKDADLL